MKVLVVSEPGVDGVFRYVEMLCHFLVEQGAEVHLAFSTRRGSDRLLKLVEWIEEHGGLTVNLDTANQPAFSDWGAFRSLLRLARTVRPDVIHSHSSKAGFLARSLFFFGVKAAQFYHPHAYIGMRPQRQKLDFVYNMVEAILGRTAYTIVVSAAEKSFALERLKIPPARVYNRLNGVDTDLFSPVSPEEKRRRRKALGLPLDQPILGFIGRSSAQKDPLTLYRAFAKAAAEKPLSLFHLGKGEFDAELDALVNRAGLQSRVFRRPYMSAPVDFYRVVDGFILTSHYEGFSLAVLEALAADLPIILSDAPGNVDLFDQPLSHAWKAPSGDIEGFAQAIRAWHEKLDQQVPINHRQVALSQFNLQERMMAILELYRKLAKPTSHRNETEVEWEDAEFKSHKTL